MADHGQRKRKVMIVDDHPIMRDGISQLIDQQADMEVCGESSSALEALAALEHIDPDLMLIDISLTGMDGLELIKAVKKRGGGTPMLVLSMHSEELYAERAVRAGAMGYVMKHASAEALLEAMRRVLSGKLYLSPGMTEKFLEKAVGGDRDRDGSPMSRLSDREMEIFKLIGQGLKPQRIAEELHLSIKTVETYYSRIKQKLHLKSASELLQTAISWHRDLDGSGPAK